MNLSASVGFRLLASVLSDRTASVLQRLDLADQLGASTGDTVDRITLASALNIALFDDLLRRVPSGAAYVAERESEGVRVVFDHGALRTVRFPEGPTGGLPAGQDAFTRLLAPLGYRLNGTYPLPRLRMTGRSWAFADAPETVPQFFVSELHVEQFSPAFAEAAQRVFGATIDPIEPATFEALERLERTGTLPLPTAQRVLAQLLLAFGRHHPEPGLADYETLLAESAEAAWIATEGNAFNHVTDRVPDVDALAAHEAEVGRPIKARVEVSASGRIRQTAHRAARVSRRFVDGSQLVEREVPGSFYEFITRSIDPSTGDLDLGFDSSNATGIFAMTSSQRAS